MGDYDEFKQWLTQKGYTKVTVYNYALFIERVLMAYLQEEQVSIKEFGHDRLMAFIRCRKQQGLDAQTVNYDIIKISRYLEFKKLPNVAATVRMKGITRRLCHGLLGRETLDGIYHNFHRGRNKWTHENTFKTYHIVLGLMVYQGLRQQELEKLETGHLQLGKGQVYVPSTIRANKRTLRLEPFQVLPLHEYLTTERELLSQEIEGNYLFHKKRLARGMVRIKKMVNRYEPGLKSFKQLRPSVITCWLKRYSLRQVQYMAGHKTVYATERYRAYDLQGLQKELEKYHPLGDGTFGEV